MQSPQVYLKVVVEFDGTTSIKIVAEALELNHEDPRQRLDASLFHGSSLLEKSF